MKNNNIRKCRICEKEINRKDENSYVIINDEYNCIDCTIKFSDQSNRFTNIVKAFIIIFAILGILCGIFLGAIFKNEKIENTESNSSYDSSYSYDDYSDSYLSDDEDEEQKSSFNVSLMFTIWGATVAVDLCLIFIYFHLQNQTVLIYQNRKIMSLLSSKDDK